VSCNEIPKVSWDRKRRGGTYFYLARRLNGRSIKVYLGRGPEAEAAARQLEERRRARQARREAWLRDQAQVAAAEQALQAFGELVSLLARATRILGGYHEHHGQWRRRMTAQTQGPPAKPSRMRARAKTPPNPAPAKAPPDSAKARRVPASATPRARPRPVPPGSASAAEPPRAAADRPPDIPPTAADHRAVLEGLVERANRGDPGGVAELRAFLDRHAEVWGTCGNLGRHAQRAWLELLAGEAFGIESVTRFVEHLRAELAGPRPTPVEDLLVTQVVTCYLALQHAELSSARPGPSSLVQIGVRLKRSESALKRYLATLRTLAQLRATVPQGLVPVNSVQLYAAAEEPRRQRA
jgi:hypothetical protein